MSKLLKAILLPGLPLLLILQLFNISFSQSVSATITVSEANLTSVSVVGKFEASSGAGPRNLWFLKDFAGYDRLGERISDMAVTERTGQTVSMRQLIPGEFLAASDFQNWSYKIDLSPPNAQAAAAHVSWIGADRGIVMLDDVLPQVGAKGDVVVEFVLPPEWKIYTTERKIGDNRFAIKNPEKAVFIVGKGLRTKAIAHDRFAIDLVIEGNWQFSDNDAVLISREILSRYKDLFGADPTDVIQVVLMKFPQWARSGSWEADTRGSTVTVLSSDMPFKAQSLQRLHEQLRHEIFHLWIPNGVNLSGNYDWFYEGFALYISLKNGVLMNRIRFDDFLDTLSRAYMIDSFQNPRLSLIEASRRRWSGGNTTVYARGMITAFLCDLALLRRSKGKMDASNIVKEILEKYRSQETAAVGNEAALGVMKKYAELSPIVENYVRGNEAIDWKADLADAGIVAEEQNAVTALKTVEKPNGHQKEMLDKLGYNNWRKLTEISK
jgi:hypothetical protein